MPEAKDTTMSTDYVMSLIADVPKELGLKGIEAIVETQILNQAKISFKAGYFEGRGLGIRDGIKEMVEWMQANLRDEYGSISGWSVWQAKLKEWGVE